MNPCDDAGVTGATICAFITIEGENSIFYGIDCDGDGENNEEECGNGTDPLDPCSNSYVDGDAICAAIDAGATGFADVDCDGGGVNDAQECTDGTDPMNPCDDIGLTGQDICDDLTANGASSVFAGLDCDGDGETDNEECSNGTDPLDPCSNSYETGDEICDAIANGATGLSIEDCDNGGIDNQTECDNGGDPSDPSDDCDFVMDGTVDICELLAADANNTLATEDCDGDGEDNGTECANGTDPTDPCSNSYADGDAVCAAIAAGATGFADVD